MKMFKQVLIALGALALAACGGGGGAAGTSPFGGGAATNTAAKSIDVLAGSLSVGSGDSVLITAIVKGDGNVSLANAAVTFATDSGNLTSASAKTDSAGVATATLSSGTNKDNRTITVTVTSGSAQGTVQVAITGTKLAYAGSTTVALGATVPVSVTATDSKGAAIAGMSIAVTSSLNNGLSATAVTTDALGVATLNYTATNPGADTLKFEGGGTSVSPTIRISAENFVFISPAANAKIPVGVANATAVTVRYLSNGAPQVGKTINFAATAGIVTPSSAVTNANGDATVSVYSNTASPATIQATLVGSSVAAQATLPVQFVALVPAKVVLQVAPTAVGPNLVGSTAQQADLIATVTDVNGNPVQDVTVNFNRIADPSGGNLSQASNVTDAGGQTKVKYIAGPLTTASNGVQLRAMLASNAAIFGDATLTVNQSALFIALGTGNTITNIDEQTYKKDWVVYVTDANGIAVPNINLTIKILPLEYGKGTLTFNTAWVYSNNVVFCPNEDDGAGTPSNAYNGVLDAGEDRNGSGTLEPGNVISVTPGIVKTDATGRATLSVIYAESYAPWVKVKLRAEAVVSGTESSKEALFVVSGSSSDFGSQSNPPAGVTSPFGINGCATPN